MHIKVDVNTEIEIRELTDLPNLRFIEQKENIVFLGSSGVGKNHLETSIGIAAAKKRTGTYFIKCNDLILNLKKAKLVNRLETRLKHQTKYKLLIIDEIGCIWYSKIEPPSHLKTEPLQEKISLATVAKGEAGVITLKMKQEIIQLHLEGLSERKIAKQTKKARNTVRKYIKQFKQSRHEDVQDLPITEEVLRPPTYKKRKGKQRVLTEKIKAKLRGYIKENQWKKEISNR